MSIPRLRRHERRSAHGLTDTQTADARAWARAHARTLRRQAVHHAEGVGFLLGFPVAYLITQPIKDHWAHWNAPPILLGGLIAFPIAGMTLFALIALALYPLRRSRHYPALFEQTCRAIRTDVATETRKSAEAAAREREDAVSAQLARAVDERSEHAARLLEEPTLNANVAFAAQLDSDVSHDRTVIPDVDWIAASEPSPVTQHLAAHKTASPQTTAVTGADHLRVGRQEYVRARTNVTELAFRLQQKADSDIAGYLRLQPSQMRPLTSAVWEAVDAGVAFPDIVGAVHIAWPYEDLQTLQATVAAAIDSQPEKQGLYALRLNRSSQARRN